jgi:hypothetical protein
MFRLFRWLPTRTARTHAACVSLSFFNDVKQREGFIHPSINATDAKPCRTPFRAVPAVSSQCIRNSHEVCGAGRHRVPQCWALYEAGPLPVKHLLTLILRLRNHQPDRGFFGHAAGHFQPSSQSRRRAFCPHGQKAAPAGFPPCLPQFGHLWHRPSNG